MKGITKGQLCWVIIRCLGWFCLIQFVTSLTPLIQMSSVLGGSSAVSGFPTTMSWLVVAYGLIAVYCPAAGVTLHRLLMSESLVKTADHRPASGALVGSVLKQFTAPTPNQEPVDPVTQLTKQETVPFRSWLERHPEYSQQVLKDQIALFRDAQGQGKSGAGLPLPDRRPLGETTNHLQTRQGAFIKSVRLISKHTERLSPNDPHPF